MDGSTWHRYRLVTWSSGEPSFFLEPINPRSWPGVWISAGFVPLATYQSSLNQSMGDADERLEHARTRASAAGLGVRPIDPDRFEQELRAIFDLSLEAFADNFLYTPIGWDEFAAMYAKLRPLIDPRLVLLSDDPAARAGRLAGFLISIPDQGELQREGRARTLILKTLAVHPLYRSCGLGSWLVAHAQSAGAALGLSRSIFALMHDSNNSARIGERYGQVLRRYTLFSRVLA
jgi:GNAT superfamily N-acetyltransferase